MSSGEESGDYTDDDASWEESGDESETDRASGGSETGSEQSGSGSEWGTGDETEHSESEYSEYSTGDEGETESETESESEGETEYASVTPSRGMGGGMSNPMKQRGMAQTSHRGLVKTIFIYRNGDAFFPARKVVFGYKIRTFIYLLEWITEEIHPPFGAVRKLFDLSKNTWIIRWDTLLRGQQQSFCRRLSFPWGNIYKPTIQHWPCSNSNRYVSR